MRYFYFLLLLISISPTVYGSGYALYEMNAAAHGMAHAYICRVDDPSAVWYNPAALTRVERSAFYGSTTYIRTSADFVPQLTGNRIDGEQGNFFPTNFYYGRRFSDQLVFGAGFYTPFGLTTEWPLDSIAALVSKRAQLRTFYFTPAAAYKLTPTVSIGGGLDFVFASVDLERRISVAPFAPVSIFNEIDGNAVDVGFNLGTLIETESGWNFAITYKNKVNLDLSGDTRFTDVPALVAPLFPDGPVQVKLPLPRQLLLGASTTFEDWSLEGNLVWTQWNALDAISLDFENNTPVLQDTAIRRLYDNSWSLRLGAEYSWSERISFRGGLLFDQTPVPDQAVDPILPDGTRTGITLGAGYDADAWSFDVAYMATFFQDRTSPPNNFIDPPGNLVAAGNYDNSAHLLAFGFGYKF